MATEGTLVTMNNDKNKEIRINLPKAFSGKRTEFKRFIQDCLVYTAINKSVHDHDDKKIAFVLSFMNEGDAAAWKEEYIDVAINSEGEITFGTFDDFKTRLVKAFAPYDAPGDALEEMRRMRLAGNQSMDEHIARFRILVSQSQIPVSAALSDFFRETLPLPLQRQILCCDSPPETLDQWFEKASRFQNNFKCMQRILGRGKEQTRQGTGQQTPRRTFSFPRKERDPNAMDVDRLSVDERTKLMKEGKCFRCKQFGHLSRECPGKGNTTNQNQTPAPKKWTGKEAATHIRSLIANMDKEEKEKLLEEAEGEQGLGF